MSDPANSDTAPTASIETFLIDLGHERAVEIVLDDGSVEVTVSNGEGVKQAFIAEDDADDYCGHGSSRREWRSGWIDGRDEVLAGWKRTVAVVERWHEENHSGTLRFCYAEPCCGMRLSGGFDLDESDW